jgi:hypothetical protein
MLYATDHAADLRRVGVLDLVPDTAQAERTQRFPLLLVGAIA